MFVVSVVFGMAFACACVVHLDLETWRHGLIAFTLVTTLSSIARSCAAPIGDIARNWLLCAVACATYVYRIVWLHCTVERHCLEVWPRSSEVSEVSETSAALFSPLFGRLVAAAGETIFVLKFALPTAMPRQHARDTRLAARAVWAMLCVAEVISTIGVVMRSYLLFAIENSIWASLVATLVRQSERARVVAEGSFRAELLRAMGIGLVAYNVFVDVPMYMRFHSQSEPLRLREHGLRDALRCRFYDGDHDVWRPHMTWMFLNFVATPTCCFCLASLHESHALLSKQKQ